MPAGRPQASPGALRNIVRDFKRPRQARIHFILLIRQPANGQRSAAGVDTPFGVAISRLREENAKRVRVVRAAGSIYVGIYLGSEHGPIEAWRMLKKAGERDNRSERTDQRPRRT